MARFNASCADADWAIRPMEPFTARVFGGDETGSVIVGGLLGIVFSNPRGELVIPAMVTGTFGQPRFAPDAERAARLKVDGMGGLGEATGNLLDRFRKKK